MTMFLEIIGYAASVVTAFSLMMKNIRKLRWWNFAGAAVFSLYGALIGAWPVFAMNAFVAIVDVYYLVRMNRQQEYFDLVEVDVHGSDFVKRFLEFYHDDILRFFPEFQLENGKAYRACFCLRNVRPTNLIIFSALPGNEVLVDLDYAIPEYRDMKTGRFVYDEGIKRLGLDQGQVFVSRNAEEAHNSYLRALGFIKQGDVYIKKAKSRTPAFTG
ncbi:MAG: hypothetical protein PHX07_00570 [Candidatus Marinimicrobia bacterium]|jgi:hypothetical protein|nr:hypothetical protein [Candidatus Neomarinimicrobiota bacterium]